MTPLENVFVPPSVWLDVLSIRVEDTDGRVSVISPARAGVDRRQLQVPLYVLGPLLEMAKLCCSESVPVP